MVPMALSAREGHDGDWICLECEVAGERRPPLLGVALAVPLDPARVVVTICPTGHAFALADPSGPGTSADAVREQLSNPAQSVVVGSGQE